MLTTWTPAHMPEKEEIKPVCRQREVSSMIFR